MSFSYQVMTKEEANRERTGLLEDGTYTALITNATHRVSGSGNPMIELDLQVYGKDGTPHFVKDYLVFIKSMMWKVIHAAESAGLKEKYESGKLCPEDLHQKEVSVEIKTQTGKMIPFDKLNGKPEGSTYPDKNFVYDYSKEVVEIKLVFPKPETYDEDIPF